MSDATHGAEDIRNDINALSQRYAVVKRDETCKVSKSCTFGFEYPEFTSNFSLNHVCLTFPSKRRSIAVTFSSSY